MWAKCHLRLYGISVRIILKAWLLILHLTVMLMIAHAGYHVRVLVGSVHADAGYCNVSFRQSCV